MNVKRLLADGWSLAKKTVSSWIDDDASSMGAALSYYTVFSLAPILLIVISVAGLIFGEKAAHGALFGELGQLMGDDAAKAAESLLASADKPGHGLLGTAVGVIVMLVGATTVFAQLQNSLDRIWRAPTREGSGLWNLLRTRFLSFGMILGIAFLLMVSLVVSAVISAIGEWWGPAFGGVETLSHGVNFVFGFAVTTLMFAAIYKVMPRVRVRWRDVWIGAAVTSLLFGLGRYLIGLYLGKSAVASGYGAAGSIIIIFLAQIFLMGAEFTAVYARTSGSMRLAAGSASEVTSAGQPAAASDRPASANARAADVGTANPRTAAARPGLPLRPPEAMRSDRRGSWATLATSVAVWAALRYLVPRLARRL